MYKKQILNSLFILVLNLCFNTISSSQFEQVYPSEYVSAIDQITFHDSGAAIAVLRCNGILRSADHGNTWTYGIVYTSIEFNSCFYWGMV